MKGEPEVANSKDIAKAIDGLRALDSGKMVDWALEMPVQVIRAVEASGKYSGGEQPLDRSTVNLVGLGGSAVAGELLLDMAFPRKLLHIHFGVVPPRDRCGVIVSSYSGETGEINEVVDAVTGGIRPIVFLTSGGELKRRALELGLPVWEMPEGYQPRAAIGWSLGLVAAALERWGILPGLTERLAGSALRLASSLGEEDWKQHPLIRATLPIAEAINGRISVIFYSQRCRGAARRLASQISENAKQPAFAIEAPEAMHNSVEGIAAGDRERWALLFMSDGEDPVWLRRALSQTMNYLAGSGFRCVAVPASGSDQLDRMLSRIVVIDFISLFLAAKRGVDPTPIEVISALKREIWAQGV